MTDRTVTPMTEATWSQVWPFFDQIVQDGETFAYPTDLTYRDALALWTIPPPGRTVVMWEGSSIVGSDHGSQPPRPRQPRGHRLGDGGARGPRWGRRARALGQTIIDWHRHEGFRGIQFNAVVETNLAAVHLWTDLGFEIICTVPEAFDSRRHGLVGLHVMHLRL